MDVDIPVLHASQYFPPMSQTLKRKRTFRSGRKPAKKRLRLTTTNRMAIRTGGWANPARGGELKFVDTSPALTVLISSTAWSAGVLLNGLVPGSGADQRIGRKVIMTSLLYRIGFILGATSTGGSPLRLLIVYDKQANAAAPAITDILDTDHFLARQNLSNRDRFVVLADKHLPPISVQNNFSVISKIYKKRLNLETCFNAGVAGTIGDITSGSVYVFAAQTSGIGTGAPSIVSRCRIRYRD